MVSIFTNTTIDTKSGFVISPELFNAIDVRLYKNKVIFPVVDYEVFFKPKPTPPS